MSIPNFLNKKKKSKSQIICQNLHLNYQTIFQDYKCTLITLGNSYFGRLYIGQENVLFISNMFGIVKQYAILIDHISSLTGQQEHIIRIIERKIDKQKQQEYLLKGFKNDNAFKIIKALWKRQKLQSSIISSNQEQQPQEIDRKHQNLNDANIQINYFNPEIIANQKQKMFQIILPCSVQQFYQFFLADDAVVYPRKKHLQLKKAKNITVSPWKRNQQLMAQVRDLCALIKIKGVPLLYEARMNQICIVTKNSKEQINMKSITNMDDVPYHSYFNCQQHLQVTKQGQNKCKYSLKAIIIFHKSTYLKNSILTKTFADFKQDYKMWSENVKQILQKMQKDQQYTATTNFRLSIKKQQNLQYQSTKDDIQLKIKQNILLKPQKQQQSTSQIINLRHDLQEMKKTLKKVTIIVILLLITNILTLIFKII